MTLSRFALIVPMSRIVAKPNDDLQGRWRVNLVKQIRRASTLT